MTNAETQETPRPRVFVSSVVQGFEEFREVARNAIVRSGGEAVLVNEDFPALAISPRNACLDGVDSCDVYIAIIGVRGGWTTPSGKLVVEEEYERATANGLPVVVFLQNAERDADAARLASKLSDYVTGTYRCSFETPQGLEVEVERALESVLAVLKRPVVSDEQFLAVFDAPFQLPNETTLRVGLTPERTEEVIDPVLLGAPEFLETVYRLGHTPTIRLFSYQQPKSARVENQSLVIRQESIAGVHTGVEEVRLEVSESGQVVIDTNVTGRTIESRKIT